MAPLIKLLQRDGAFQVSTCVTGQHREMLDQVLKIFDISPDYNLNIMGANQTLNEIVARTISALDEVLKKELPDWVLVHGDTTTAMAASITAFQNKVRIGHVEAGLRTYDMTQPWPEEINRRIVDTLSSMLFAPTAKSKENLLTENLGQKCIHVTGNTVIDSLLWALEAIRSKPNMVNLVESRLPTIPIGSRIILVTGHRRENFGSGFEEVCRALRQISLRDDVSIVYPVHLNPNVKGPVTKLLGDIDNIFLVEPLDYLSFVWMLNRSFIVLTDSGGVQEEAPSLGKPVLVMRDVTERPEAVSAGTVKLVGTKSDKIVNAVNELLDCSETYNSFCRSINPYGDGRAAARIVSALKEEAFSEFTYSS